MAAVFNHEPFALNSSPEDVWFCMGEPRKDAKSKRPKAGLFAVPEAAAIAAELRSNPVWQELYETYCDVVGTEAQYGEEFNRFRKAAKAKAEALLAAEGEEEERTEEQKDIITENIKRFRRRTRPWTI